MIEIAKGNIIKVDAEALVNTVNIMGFMGKGIALQFKKAFPKNFEAYQRACRVGEVKPGRMFVFETGSMLNPRFIINFVTKRHWRAKSRLEDIESGLEALVQEIRMRGIVSVAVPPLGCGLGGLDWRVVRPMIENAFAEVPDVHVKLFEPVGTPAPTSMPVRTALPKMTVARALLLQLMRRYGEMAYRLTLLEIQKLGYFLQESGEPLKLRYGKGPYGPYAHNLNKVIETLEGHYISGYGDTQKPYVEIELLESRISDADTFLASYSESLIRLEKVSNLIEGFETPYGMELLSTVHWVAKHSEPPAHTVEEAIEYVQAWNYRKLHMFNPDHIRVTWNRLTEQGWIDQRHLDSKPKD